MDYNNDIEKFYFTAGQLIEALKTLPSDMPVLIRGQEGGFDNFYHPYVVKMKHETENMFMDGEFQIASKKSKNVFEAIILDRVMRD